MVIPLALAATLCVGTLPAQAATTNPNPSSRETAHAKLSRRAATEGMVLLDNTGGALPIADNGNVALFGVGAYATVKGGTGSGSVNNRATVDVRTGLEKAGYKVTTSPVYYDAMVDAVDNASGSGGIFGSIDYASLEQALTSTTVQPTAATDTALFIVARNSGEGSDRSASKGDFYLDDIEAANLRLLGQTYSKVVVVLNTGGIVDTEFFKDINADVQDPNGGQALDSLFLMSQAGQESGHALVDVLSGDVTPSGKLTDSWAANYDYYPASETFAGNDGDTLHEEYSEGIYVGYRYFDSFYKTLSSDPATVVNYPFGFGLSYTDFKIDPGKVTVSDGRINVAAKVTNTGTKASGKEVVQVYFSAPQSGLDKPYQELAGYAKTDNLAPGQSQSVTVSFDIFELSSYDEATAAYVVEKGDYVIRVGNSSRNTAVAAVLPVSTTKVVEQLTNQYNDVAPATELVSDPADFYSYADEAEQIAAAPRVTLPSSAIPFEDNSSPFDQDVAVGTDSPYYDIDKSPISSVDVYLDPDQDDWEGTGGAYPTKTGENVVATETNPEWTLYDVYRGTVTMQEFVASRRLEELANIVEGTPSGGSITSVVGAAGYTTSRYEDLGIAGMSLVDGPAGVRVTNTLATNPVSYQWATAFPIGTLLAQTFDRALVEEVGEAVGDEMAEFEATVWLAPSFNLHRDPLNGRNFEYLSEDPLASGLVAAALTEGVQSVPGRGVSVKHFAANNQESDRNTTDSIIGERALREMYLRGFEIVVKQAQPMTVMSSYNKINNTYTAGDYDLLTDLLRGEWGFKGLVMTDWGGIRAGAVNTMYAGNDLITPGNNPEEMINASLKNTPRIDVNGLPVHRQIEQLMGTFLWVQHRWGFNSLIPSATGTETVATTVDATTDLSQVPASVVVTADAINNEVVTHRDPYTSVNEAYEEVATILDAAGDSWGATMTSAEAAGVTLSGIVREDPADDSSPVVSYTVTVRGDYPAAGYTMRLGDLQRSAANVLNVVMHSAPFEHLADANGVSGINVGPYADQFDNLHEFMVTGLGKVTDPETKPSPMPQPTVTVTARPEIGFTPQRPYEVPGYHEINGRRWYTECEYYSQTVRCRTNIWSTVVRYEAGGKFVTETGWHFNNLTYLPYMKRAQWADNPLGKTGTFTSSGRNWRTECDTAATGRGACRSYAWVTNVVETRKDSAGATRYVPVSKWVFNNIVRFRAN